MLNLFQHLGYSGIGDDKIYQVDPETSGARQACSSSIPG